MQMQNAKYAGRQKNPSPLRAWVDIAAPIIGPTVNPIEYATPIIAIPLDFNFSS